MIKSEEQLIEEIEKLKNEIPSENMLLFLSLIHI